MDIVHKFLLNIIFAYFLQILIKKPLWPVFFNLLASIYLLIAALVSA